MTDLISDDKQFQDFQRSSQDSELGSVPLSGESAELYEGVDDILQVQIQDDCMSFGTTGSGDLYDDAVMCSTYGRGKSTVRNLTTLSPDEEYEDQETSGDKSDCKARTGNRKIPQAYSDDIVDAGVTPFSPKPKDHLGHNRESRPRRYAVYLGNLTWWTNKEDIIKACSGVGIMDVVGIKILECRLNGQSKGFAAVSFSSERSMILAIDKLSSVKIHSNVLIVKPENKQSLQFLDSVSKTRPLLSSSMMCQHGGHTGMMQGPRGMGMMGFCATNTNGPSHFGMPPHRPLGPMRNPFPRNQGFRPGPRSNGPFMGSANPPFQNEVHNGYPPAMPNGPRMGMPRGPPPPPVSMNNSYSSFDEWNNSGNPPPSHFGMMIRPGMPPPHMNPAFLGPRYFPPSQRPPPDSTNLHLRAPVPFPLTPPTLRPPGTVGDLRLSQESTFSPQRLQNFQDQGSPFKVSTFNEDEIEDLLNRNNSVSTAAIKRAVNDAGNGEYASAIETLVTAISLIRSSKIARDKRCIVLINSLHDTLEGIENKSYGSARKARSSSTDRNRKSRRYRRTSRSRSPSSISVRRSRSRDRHDYGSYSRTEDREYRVRRDREYSRNHSNESKESSRWRLRNLEDRERGRRSPSRFDRDIGGERSRIDRLEEDSHLDD